MLRSPVSRLVLRALLAGLGAFVAALQGQTLTASAVEGAIVAGVLAVLEVVTPLNRTVGVGSAQH